MIVRLVRGLGWRLVGLSIRIARPGPMHIGVADKSEERLAMACTVQHLAAARQRRELALLVAQQGDIPGMLLRAILDDSYARVATQRVVSTGG